MGKSRARGILQGRGLCPARGVVARSYGHPQSMSCVRSSPKIVHALNNDEATQNSSQEPGCFRSDFLSKLPVAWVGGRRNALSVKLV